MEVGARDGARASAQLGQEEHRGEVLQAGAAGGGCGHARAGGPVPAIPATCQPAPWHREACRDKVASPMAARGCHTAGQRGCGWLHTRGAPRAPACLVVAGLVHAGGDLPHLHPGAQGGRAAALGRGAAAAEAAAAVPGCCTSATKARCARGDKRGKSGAAPACACRKQPALHGSTARSHAAAGDARSQGPTPPPHLRVPLRQLLQGARAARRGRRQRLQALHPRLDRHGRDGAALEKPLVGKAQVGHLPAGVGPGRGRQRGVGARQHDSGWGWGLVLHKNMAVAGRGGQQGALSLSTSRVLPRRSPATRLCVAEHGERALRHLQPLGLALRPRRRQVGQQKGVEHARLALAHRVEHLRARAGGVDMCSAVRTIVWTEADHISARKHTPRPAPQKTGHPVGAVRHQRARGASQPRAMLHLRHVLQLLLHLRHRLGVAKPAGLGRSKGLADAVAPPPPVVLQLLRRAHLLLQEGGADAGGAGTGAGG